MPAPQAPRIAPPADPHLHAQLKLKLDEYKKRVVGKGKPWERMHPEQAHMTNDKYRDACYKTDVLAKVLESTTPVDTVALSLELAAKYGDDFNAEQFCVACAVIAAYCEGRSGEVTGGHGMPTVTTE